MVMEGREALGARSAAFLADAYPPPLGSGKL
jgi:hypothetical protein